MKTNLLRIALFTPVADGRWGLPIILWGQPGIAKSATFRLLGQQYGLPVEILTPGARGEGAYGVTPYPQETKHGPRMTYPRPDWTDRFLGPGDEDRGGIVLADEINTAAPALQPAQMGLIQDRVIGSYALPKRVRVMGAANPVACAAGGWDIAPPLANRCGHLDAEKPSVAEWGDWLLGGADGWMGEIVDARAEEERVLKRWPTDFAKASGTVLAFLRTRSGLHHAMPAEGDPNLSRAWCSPRSWENATRALAACDAHAADDLERDELVRAFVGAGAATEFAKWRIALDLPDPAAVLDGRVKFEHEPKRLDRSYAVLSACASLVAPASAEKRKPRAAALWIIMGDVAKSAADVTVPAARVMCDKNVRLTSFPEARPVLVKLQPMLQAAGFAGGDK